LFGSIGIDWNATEPTECEVYFDAGRELIGSMVVFTDTVVNKLFLLYSIWVKNICYNYSTTVSTVSILGLSVILGGNIVAFGITIITIIRTIFPNNSRPGFK
jgi:hypothetical protein